MALPGDVATCTLTFGPYVDADGNVEFDGMTGTITPSTEVVHIVTGTVIVKTPIKVYIGANGAGSIVLPHTDLAVATPTGFTYTLTWDGGRFTDTPGNATFALPTSAGSTVQYDKLTPATMSPGVAVPTNVGPQGPTGATGPQGPQGLPGANTDAAVASAYGPLTGAKVAADPLLKAAYVPFWAAVETVTAGVVRMSPTGQTITRNSNGTTRSSYDTTEQALWTVTASGSGGSGFTVTDNGDGTFTAAGPGVTDNGDGTFILAS